ncbi:glycine zipper 2TM domain-containing protein [Teredinibacter purpureus]|uniref:glycine zipper 2TM domain-containing protein n=1 Tax=Teredinibacter purpureus TaxID=2731756 RepID=UPI0005F7FF61|nr:glycine zipper 2TM domain-containing protein [Teredinibacter purpureus]
MNRPNSILTLLTLSICLLSPATLAGNNRNTIRHVDYGIVIAATPLYETVERSVPVERCWTERVREETPVYHTKQGPKRDSTTSMIVGSLIGGAFGNAVGAGDENKKVGTVVGAVLGASIGRDIGRQQRVYSHTTVNYRDVEQCDVQAQIHSERITTGYTVTYRYHGETYTTRTRRDPGKKLKIAVSIQPLEH